VSATALEHRYVPRGAAQELGQRRDAEVVISGPAGTGKSRACLEKIHLMCLLNPGMRALIVRKTATSLATTAIKTLERFVIPEAMSNFVVTFYGGGPREAPQYRYQNGSTITIGGLDRPSRIMSSEYDLIYVQEATELTINDWESLTTRLRSWVVSFQQLIADCNPDKPTHWLRARSVEGRTVMLESRHEDNPELFDDDGQITEHGAEYLGKLDKLTGPRYLRLRKGIWAAAEGLVYDGFDPALHVVDLLPPPLEWPRAWSIDFGYTNPFVCGFWAIDPDGRLYLYREIYRTKRTVAEHAAKILRSVMHEGRHRAEGWREPRPQVVVCDHDAEGRAVFEKETGLVTTPAHKAVTEGIQAVQRRLQLAGDGRPRLFLHRNALIDPDAELVESKRPTCTLDEFPGYVWDGSTERPKETPVKADDHGLDMTRYLVAHYDLRPEYNVRFID